MNSPLGRILYVITDLEIGGVPLHLHRLARAMRDRGWSPRVVSLAPPGPVAGRLLDDGIEVQSCEGTGGWDVRVLVRLARIMRAADPHVVHALLFHANIAARLTAWEVGIEAQRVVCEIQTVEVERPWHLTAWRWTHRGCRFTIGNSPSVIEHLSGGGGIPRHRLRLVRGGIDPAPFTQAAPVERASLGLPAGSPLVLWTGRLDPIKGLYFLIEAFSTIAARHDAHLLLAGTGPLRDQVTEWVARRSLQGRIHLLGARSDVPSLLKTADVFAFPSRSEGLPNALLEAMAARRPIVTTDVPGCRDVIQHLQTGLVVPYADTTALSDALTTLLTDGVLARRLAASAGDAVARHWTAEAMYDAYERVYREACTAGHGPRVPAIAY